MVVAKQVFIHVGHFARSIVRSPLRTPAVAHHHGHIVFVGIVHDFLHGIRQVGVWQTVDTSQIEVGTGRHAAIGGIGVVVGDGDGGAIHHHARATGGTGGVRAVVFCFVISERARNGSIFLCCSAAIIDVCPLDARVAVLVLEGDVAEVDASVDDAEHHSRSVVFLTESCTDGIGRERQQVVDVGGLAGGLRLDVLQRRHVDALHVADGCHVHHLVHGDERGEEAFAELLLNDDALRLYLAATAGVGQTHVGCDVGLAVDGVGGGIDAPRVFVVALPPLVNGRQSQLFLSLGAALRNDVSRHLVEKHLCGGRQLLACIVLCKPCQRACRKDKGK